MEDLDHPWANQDGACRALALPTPSRRHSLFGMYKRQKLMGDTLISMSGTPCQENQIVDGFDCS